MTDLYDEVLASMDEDARESTQEELFQLRVELEEVRRHARALAEGLKAAMDESWTLREENRPYVAYSHLMGYLRPTLRWLHDLGSGE